jgi:hypothetical protein
MKLMKMRWMLCAFIVCIASLAVSAKSRRSKAPVDPAQVEGSKEWWAEKKKIASEKVRCHLLSFFLGKTVSFEYDDVHKTKQDLFFFACMQR